MIKYAAKSNLTKKLLSFTKDPVCANIISSYSICRNFLLIPKKSFTDMEHLKELLDNGTVSDCFNCSGNLQCEVN